MLEFKQEVVEFKFKGEVHQVRKPTNLELKEYLNELDNCENKDEKDDVFIKYLSNLGLKKDVYDGLLPHQLNTLVKHLNEAEKN